MGALARRSTEMVHLPGGAFEMGSDEDSLFEQFPNAGAGLRSMLLAETPRHEVTIPPYWIDRREVTNARFSSFIKANPEWRRGRVGGNYLLHWIGDQFPAREAEFPVVFITWHAAIAYAEWSGKRLPTEAEWEFAARGGRSDTMYPWGNDDPSPRLANYAASAKNAPVRAGSYPPNPYGLFDLAGNVWEFCLDEWHSPYRSHAVTQSEADLRRMCFAEAERRVIRGGSFGGGAFNMRVTSRDSHRVSDPVGHVGFRCARSA